ncbi:Anticodon-binding domain [Arabidopsis suecica]|uniref:Anticodon-binding domain n=1 Tax=Arabidopsis suecica TaxID=45249 RepID=A0A8T2BTH0_ARASU|nr:Anticodon-binding domain [Arabidopsis suecica]
MKPASATVAKHDGGGEDEKFAVGNIYAVKLITGDEFNGIVLAYDSGPNFAIFEEGMKPKPLDSKTLRMVNAKYITEMKNLGNVKDPLAKRTLINLDGLIDKENQAIRNVEKIGFGVTAEAQRIFDAISKTLPIRWDKKDMLVMGEVIVRSPYHSDCVFGGTRAVNDRVKTVLEQVRKKLQLSDT